MRALPAQSMETPRSSSTSYLASIIQRYAQLAELNTPSQNISLAPFVLILDENIAEAKEEFKEFLFAQFSGDVPPKGRIIGAVNAIWARLGSMIFVHEIGNGCSLLKVSNVRTREVILSRPTWMIAGWLGVIRSSLLGH